MQVTILVNGQESQEVGMLLGSSGEAFFLREQQENESSQGDIFSEEAPDNQDVEESKSPKLVHNNETEELLQAEDVE